MPRYKIEIEYDGSEFFGWQKQRGERTVQGELERALEEFGEGRIKVIGAGRTDTGVHALGQAAHFDMKREMAPESLMKALNVKISYDVAVKSAEVADSTFHARYDALRRRYLYVLSKHRSAIGRRFSWLPPFDYNFALLQSLTADIVGEHDFSAFCRRKSRKESSVCTIYHAAWVENEAQCVFEIVGDRFLHSMVRFLVGTMLDIARGRFEPDALPEIIAGGDVRGAGAAAPPQGLFLAQVFY